MGLFDKLLMGGGDPNSEIGQAQDEAMKEMIGEFIGSEKGQRIMSLLMGMIVPAFDGLKKEMGNDEKFFMFRMNKKTGTPVFWILDSKKMTVEEKDGIESTAVVLCKPIDDPSVFIQELISGELLNPSAKKEIAENKPEEQEPK